MSENAADRSATAAAEREAMVANADGGFAGGDSAATLLRVHVLPLVQADTKLGDQSRMEYLAPELRRKRSSKDLLKMGDLITKDDCDFAVIKCEPAEGILDTNTDYFIDGPPVVLFDKIEFSAWGPAEMTPELLFSECITNYFQGEFTPYGKPGSKRVRLFYPTQIFQIGDVYFQVEATEPAGLGIVTSSTEIFAHWDTTPDFEKIHIVPFQDTLPRAYEFDIFHDYLKPYLHVNEHKKFQSNELFMYHGVQFKVVACEPDVTARIGKATTIFCEGVLQPALRNLLPPDLLNQVSQLPLGLQILLLNTERTTRELEDMLTQRRGLFEETINEIPKFNWPPSDISTTSQTSCMVCLADFTLADDCRRLPCNHIFHSSCIEEWLRRCTDCPICKNNVDRAIRNY